MDPTETEVRAAIDVLRYDYWADVRLLAAEIEQRIMDGEIKREDVSDAIHEVCDGAQRVIYTQRAKLTIAVADGYSFSEYEAASGEPCQSPYVAAFFVLNRDVSALVFASDTYNSIDSEAS